MLYKENWVQTFNNFRAWWENELDRPIIQVTAPRKGVKDLPWWDIYYPPCWGFAKDPDHPEATLGQFEEWCSKIFFGAEAYPNLWINLGPNIVAAYVGAKVKFREDSKTVWFERPLEWEELEKIRFDPDSPRWRLTKDITSLALSKAEGRFFVGFTDLCGVTDCAVSLRGSQNLVKDLFKNGEKVKTLSWKLLEIWHAYYDELYRILEGDRRGSSGWMGIWSPKKTYPLQCDWGGAYLSPKMFREFALPYIREQCVRIDDAIYHLDGPMAIPTLDMLLDIPELDGIQWTPGEGNPPVDSSTWFPLYKKVQSRGKRLVLLGAGEDKVEYLIENLSPKGLLIQMHCKTEENAEALLKKLSLS